VRRKRMLGRVEGKGGGERERPGRIRRHPRRDQEVGEGSGLARRRSWRSKD
jgi:hypothetical protein